MRSRAKVTKVTDIKRDPDMRIVFQKPNYPEFVKLLAIGDEYAINPTTLSRHLILIFVRKMEKAVDKQSKDRLITEIMQSMHGLTQIDMFQKPEPWDNIQIERNENREVLDMMPRTKKAIKSIARKGKGKKK